MSKTLVCFSETVPFYTSDHCKEAHYAYETFPEKADNLVLTQDENNYVKQSSNDNMIPKQTLPRKREASNILVECVKRRDNLRNIDSSFIPYELSSIDYSILESIEKEERYVKDECSNSVLLVNKDFFEGSDSGIESDKSNSPVSSTEGSSASLLDEDFGQDVMDTDSVSPFMKLESDSSTITFEAEYIHSAVAEEINCLHTSQTSVSSSSKHKCLKSSIIQSLFKNMPLLINFAIKDEIVSDMPEDIVGLLKWKLSTITPAIIKETVLKAGFSLVEAEPPDEWLGTWGKHQKCSSYKTIKSFQKVNHYPGAFHLGRKDRLWQNYSKMLARHGSEEFNFFPETFILPAGLKALKEAWGEEGDKCWIVKPCASARGTGVKVIYKWSQVPKVKPFVAQQYISNPYLINGSKFDLRMYVIISSVEPLRVYVFEDGLVRFASEKYSLTNKSFANRFIHLTNYSINKKSSTYAVNDDEKMCQGHKWSLKSFWAYMADSGIDVAKIQETISDMIIKTVLSAEGPICRLMKMHAKTSYNCFELFGFDIMLDKDLHPWLLEVNISPSLHTKSLLDLSVKGPLVKDMLNIAGFEVPKSSTGSLDNSVSNPVDFRHKPLHNKQLSPEEKQKHALYTYSHSSDENETDILNHLTLDDLGCLIESEDELHRCGNFTRIFPTHATNKYFHFFDHIRYYNVLLDAWEKNYHMKREVGIKLLQAQSEKRFQPQAADTETESKKTIGA